MLKLQILRRIHSDSNLTNICVWDFNDAHVCLVYHGKIYMIELVFLCIQTEKNVVSLEIYVLVGMGEKNVLFIFRKITTSRASNQILNQINSV